jgi:hypothetical protein
VAMSRGQGSRSTSAGPAAALSEAEGVSYSV